jgi:hypothetical protein
VRSTHSRHGPGGAVFPPDAEPTGLVTSYADFCTRAALPSDPRPRCRNRRKASGDRLRNRTVHQEAVGIRGGDERDRPGYQQADQAQKSADDVEAHTRQREEQ